jgi:hypothetical protein
LKITIVLFIVAILRAWAITPPPGDGVGVGGLAIALAAQKTVENFFGEFAIITDRQVATASGQYYPRPDSKSKPLVRPVRLEEV